MGKGGGECGGVPTGNDGGPEALLLVRTWLTLDTPGLEGDLADYGKRRGVEAASLWSESPWLQGPCVSEWPFDLSPLNLDSPKSSARSPPKTPELETPKAFLQAPRPEFTASPNP